MGQIDLKPYGFFGLLDAAFRIYRRNFGLLFWITAVFFVLPFFAEEIVNLRFIGPQDLLTRVIDYMGNVAGQESEFDVEELQQFQGLACYTIPISLLLFIIMPLSQGPIVNAIHQNAVGNGCTFREAFRIGWRKYLSLFLGFLLLNLIIAVIIAFLFVPIGLTMAFGRSGPGVVCLLFVLLGTPVTAAVLYLLILFSLYSQSIVLEGRGAFGALVRSARLIRGYWWRALGVFFAIQIIISFIYSFSELAFGSLNSILASIDKDYEILGHATIATGLTVVQIFTTPILVLGQTILFYDLKVRHEAYDLERMIEGF